MVPVQGAKAREHCTHLSTEGGKVRSSSFHTCPFWAFVLELAFSLPKVFTGRMQTNHLGPQWEGGTHSPMKETPERKFGRPEEKSNMWYTDAL
jgi:hypothetical protein